MRLVFPRAAAARTLLVAAAAAALVTTVLMTAFLLYAYLLPVAGVRAAVADAPVEERSLLLTSSAGRTAEELAARDAAARELFAGGLAGVPLAVHAGGHGIGQRLPDDHPGVDPGLHGAYAVVAYLSGLAEHATLVTGAWPEPVAPDAPAQVAVPDAVAEAMALAVGDQVPIVDEVAQEERPVEVVGVWRATDPTDPYWRLAATPVDQGSQGPFVVHRDEFAARYQRLATLEWVAVASGTELAGAGMGEVAGGVEALATDLRAHQDDPASPLDGSTRLRTGLAELAERLATATVVNRSGLVLPAALLGVIAGYALVLVARLLTAHRRGENALLRARGASRRQLVRFTAVEATLVVAPAAVLAAPAGTWLVGLVDDRAGGRSLGLAGDLARYGWAGPPLAWAVAGAAALGCALALALPAAGRGRTWVAEQQERSRPSRAAAVQRAGLDVALVALAVLAWTQLRQYGAAVTPRDVGGLGVDPLLVAAPVVGVLAATAVTLRLLPLATRLGVRLAGRRDAFPGLLGMWQADRRPHAGPVLLLVLAVATAVLAPAVAATWQRSQHDQTRLAVGADLRLASADPQVARELRQLGELPEVTGAMAGHRTMIGLPGGRRVPLLALDSDRAPGVARLRADLAPGGVEALFGMLRERRPELAGVALPEGARRLVGTLRFEAPEPVVETIHIDGTDITFDLVRDPPGTHQPVAYLADGDGLISSLRLGSLAPGDPLPVDVALPPGATTLVGLAAGLSLPVDYGPPEGTARVSWHWDELAVVDAAGERVPLELPADWRVASPGESEGDRPEITRVGGEPAATAVINPQRHRPQQVPFLLGAAPAVPEVPALVTPAVLAATGAAVGDLVELGGEVTVQIAGTVAALPGVAGGDGVVVDLEWLSLQRFSQLQEPPRVSEWWLATRASPAVLAAAAEWPVIVHDQRAEVERLLADPLGSGVLWTLWAAAAGSALLAAFGLAVDSRANAVRRQRELAVLHTLGVSPAGLARALVVEQAVLAGLGVTAGVGVGVGVAAAMGTSLVLTPAGEVPVPAPLLTLAPAPLAAPTVGLFLVAVVLGALVARRARREVMAGALRIGDD